VEHEEAGKHEVAAASGLAEAEEVALSTSFFKKHRSCIILVGVGR